jgi:hypothetical protein
MPLEVIVPGASVTRLADMKIGAETLYHFEIKQNKHFF